MAAGLIVAAVYLYHLRGSGDAWMAPLKRKAWTVVIDPGHGGHDTGAIGPGGLQEKDATLDIALRLKRELARRGDFAIVMTRAADVAVSLDERVGISNRSYADILVSLHINAWKDPKVHGYETFYFDSPAVAGSQYVEASMMLADLVQNGLVARPGLETIDRGVKSATFRVLIPARMPAVLVELGFITNPAEEARLRDSVVRQAVADTIAAAIGQYRGMYPDGFRLLPRSGRSAVAR